MSENLRQDIESIKEIVDEIAARCRRLETRQTKISLSQGFDPTVGKARMKQISPGRYDVSGLDVSLGDIKKCLTDTGNSGRVVHLFFDGQVVAIVEILAVQPKGEEA